MMEGIIIIERLPTVAEFNSLRELVGWGKISNEIVEKGLASSLYSICAMMDDRVMACCRLVGDGAMKVYIEELMVQPDFQKRGIGTKMMNHLMDYIRKNYKPGCRVGLFSNKNLEFFYRRFGFIRRKENMPGMQLQI